MTDMPTPQLLYSFSRSDLEQELRRLFGPRGPRDLRTYYPCTRRTSVWTDHLLSLVTSFIVGDIISLNDLADPLTTPRFCLFALEAPTGGRRHF
jgi:hypothetical protein